MGICVSCLGLDRRHSQAFDEHDPLLDDDHEQYGAMGGGSVFRPDEEELRREREALENITAEATDNMIDVLHPRDIDLGRRLAQSTSLLTLPAVLADEHLPDYSDEDAAAWLRSLGASKDEDLSAIKGMEPGALVLDAGQLRVEPPGLAPRKHGKARLLD